jgi:predicted peptidase
MRIHLLMPVILLGLLPAVVSEPKEPESDNETVQTIHLELTIDDQEYAWAIMIPKTAEKGGAGLLFLHGYGECGQGGKKQLTVGLPPAVMKNPEQWPFVIIAPQKPVFNSEWEDHTPAIMAMIKQAIGEGYIDSDRLAITGLSQGGHGTIHFAAESPEMFRAAAPVCGYVERRITEDQFRMPTELASPRDEVIVRSAKAIGNLPLWIFHGEDDSVIPYAESKSLHEAREAQDLNSKLTAFPDTDHNSWDQAYAIPKLAKWFAEKTEAR